MSAVLVKELGSVMEVFWGETNRVFFNKHHFVQIKPLIKKILQNAAVKCISVWVAGQPTNYPHIVHLFRFVVNGEEERKASSEEQLPQNPFPGSLKCLVQRGENAGKPISLS